jgi:hypothetical protein
MVQLSNPSSDIRTDWSEQPGGSNQWEALSDTVNTTYLYSATPGDISMGNCSVVATPAAGGPVKFRVKYRAIRPGLTGGIFLAQMGSTTDGVVASRQVTATGGWVTTEWTLTSGELANLTDWNNLAWKLAFQSGTATQTRVTLFQIEVPDAPTSVANKWFSGWRHG